MGQVFANGLEISGKAVSARTIAAFPDVCFTPPENPATPPGVPVPYPSFGEASDTEQGTSTVMIRGKIVNIKNKSDLSKTSGTEAGCAAKKGVISSKNIGKEYFTSWSNDVKFDGEPVIRFTDLATNNHGSPANAPPWLHVADPVVGDPKCAPIVAQFHEYRHKKCPPGQKSHHVIDNSSFTMPGARDMNLSDISMPHANTFGAQKRNLFQPDGAGHHPGTNYNEQDAPCICLEGDAGDPASEHGHAHSVTATLASTQATSDGKWNYKQSRDAGVQSIAEAKGLKPWEAECVRLILDVYYKDKLKCTDSTEVPAPPTHTCSANQFNDGNGNMITAYNLV